MSNYVSLHNQTFFSLLDSLISPKELFQKAKELGQKAVAITDHGSLAATWDAFKISKDIGVKYIVGCECYFVNDTKNREGEKVRHIILLAKNAKGYQNLLLLNREGFDNGLFFAKRVYPLIDWELLSKYSEGLICLTACGSGIVSQLLNNKKFPEAEDTLLKLKAIFGDNLGVEVQPNNLKRFASAYNDSIDQDFTNSHLIRLAKKHDVRIVPASNAHYINKEDQPVHDVLLAIGAGQPIYSNARLKYETPSFYLHSEEEIKTFFARKNSADIDGWIQNTQYFADLCEEPAWVDPKFSNPSGKELPVFPVQNESDYQEFLAWKNASERMQKLDDDQAYLRYLCEKDTYGRMPAQDSPKRAEYDARLEEEFDVIEYHGFSSYMLIVADYIKWARQNDILVGPGRGSAGGSLIAYLVDIHRADPIQYNLIFARFHNKEKTSFPDIDTDFAPSGRDRVQAYVREKYGSDHVAHVSNVNTITPKVFARDIARSCELGGSREEAVKIGNNVADAIPSDIKTIEKAFEGAPLFAEYAKRYPHYLKFSAICGKYRAWSTHAGGLLISKRPLRGLVPLRKDKDGSIAVEYDKDRAEENGLVKMDMLGLSTLDIIKDTFEIIQKIGKQVPPTQEHVPLNDAATYDLIGRGDTFCVFQLGTSSGTIDLCKKVKPQSIEDISAINSLARPSAREMREDFIKTKNGEKPVDILHPSLNRAFGATYGFGLYEECLMYLAQDVAGWSLHSADRLRKLTKEKGKNPEKAAKWRQEFIDDAVKNKISEKIATRVWDEVIGGFSGYGFNLSHSVLYSMTSYYTAYLKTHYPIEFLMANLKERIASNQKSAKGDVEKIKTEIRKLNVKITPPDINKSQYSYSLSDAQTLVTGFEALKFVNEEAIKEITAKRPFRNFFDFVTRCDSKLVKSNTIQALAATGCLDSLGLTRKQIFLYCQDYRKKLQAWLKKHDPSKEEMNYPWPEEKDWTLPEKYALEKFYLGEAFVCSKKTAYAPFFDSKDVPISYIRNSTEKKVIPSMKVEIKDIFEFKVKKEGSKSFGKEMAKITVEDQFGERTSVTVFPDKWQLVKDRFRLLSKGKHKLEEGLCIHFSGTTNLYEDEVGMLLDNFYNYMPHPSVPMDLKGKKVSLRAAKEAPKQDAPKDEILSDLEDELFDEGLIEFDPEEDDDFDD